MCILKTVREAVLNHSVHAVMSVSPKQHWAHVSFYLFGLLFRTAARLHVFLQPSWLKLLFSYVLFR